MGCIGTLLTLILGTILTGNFFVGILLAIVVAFIVSAIKD